MVVIPVSDGFIGERKRKRDQEQNLKVELSGEAPSEQTAEDRSPQVSVKPCHVLMSQPEQEQTCSQQQIRWVDQTTDLPIKILENMNLGDSDGEDGPSGVRYFVPIANKVGNSSQQPDTMHITIIRPTPAENRQEPDKDEQDNNAPMDYQGQTCFENNNPGDFLMTELIENHDYESPNLISNDDDNTMEAIDIINNVPNYEASFVDICPNLYKDEIKPIHHVQMEVNYHRKLDSALNILESMLPPRSKTDSNGQTCLLKDVADYINDLKDGIEKSSSIIEKSKLQNFELLEKINAISAHKCTKPDEKLTEVTELCEEIDYTDLDYIDCWTSDDDDESTASVPDLEIAENNTVSPQKDATVDAKLLQPLKTTAAHTGCEDLHSAITKQLWKQFH